MENDRILQKKESPPDLPAAVHAASVRASRHAPSQEPAPHEACGLGQRSRVSPDAGSESANFRLEPEHRKQ